MIVLVLQNNIDVRLIALVSHVFLRWAVGGWCTNAQSRFKFQYKPRNLQTLDPEPCPQALRGQEAAVALLVDKGGDPLQALLAPNAQGLSTYHLALQAGWAPFVPYNL